MPPLTQRYPADGLGMMSSSLMMRVVRHAQRLEYPPLQEVAVEFAGHPVDENSKREIA